MKIRLNENVLQHIYNLTWIIPKCSWRLCVQKNAWQVTIISSWNALFVYFNLLFVFLNILFLERFWSLLWELCICHYTQNYMNACTLVPTVFLAHGKTEFELPVSFFVYPRRRKWEFKFLFLFFVFLVHWKRNWNFYFCFSFFHYFVQQNCNCYFCFSSSVFVWHWKTEFELRFSFVVFVFYNYDISRQ